MFYTRTLESVIQKTSTQFPVILVSGPRQVGKTTLLKTCSENNRTFVSLDNPKNRDLAINDPDLFFQTFRFPMLIDEIQYAPQLFPYIKMIVDNTSEKGLFWMTGSQQFHLMKNVAESLAGRIAIFNMLGLSQSEKLGRESLDITNIEYIKPLSTSASFIDASEIYQNIVKGSFPALFSNENTDIETFYASYLSTYVERDVRDIVNVQNLRIFEKFIEAIAARTGQILNYSDISKDIGISVNTIKSWLSILETSGIVYLLRPYFNNYQQRNIKSPKLYFLDTGLCCYILGWHSSKILEKGAMSGALLETYVVSEIVKNFWHHGKRAPLFFYRDKAQREIDLIVEQNGLLYPIEIKKTASPNINDIRSFSVIEEDKKGKGVVLCLSKEMLPLNHNTYIVPISAL